MFTEEKNPLQQCTKHTWLQNKRFSPGEVLMSLLYIGKKGHKTTSYYDETYE